MATFMSMLFGGSTKPDVLEQMKEWKRNVEREKRAIERDIRKADLEIKKAQNDCKALAKKKNEAAARLMVRHLIKAKQNVARMHTVNANLSTIHAGIVSSSAIIKVQGVMQKSTEVMKCMNQVLKLPEISDTMQVMAREMAKAGLIDDMIQETFTSIEPDGIDAEADEEVDRIFAELTADILSKAKAAPAASPAQAQAQAQAQPEAEEEADEDVEALNRRLQNL